MDKYELYKKATVTSKTMTIFFRPWKLAVVKRLQNISYLLDMRPPARANETSPPPKTNRHLLIL